jgi:DNA-directed RNA polymerase subunit E'/Rpb7
MIGKLNYKRLVKRDGKIYIYNRIMNQSQRNRPQQKSEPPKVYGVYTRSILSMKVGLDITEIGQNIKQNLERKVSKMTEGKCIEQGFIRPKSVEILQYSSGLVGNDNVIFQSDFECMVCYPVEGMLIECVSKSITKAGIHAEVVDGSGVIPVVVFVARDHHLKDKDFQEVKEGMKILIEVIGVRFELNDPYICVIGKFVEKV